MNWLKKEVAKVDTGKPGIDTKPEAKKYLKTLTGYDIDSDTSAEVLKKSFDKGMKKLEGVKDIKTPAALLNYMFTLATGKSSSDITKMLKSSLTKKAAISYKDFHIAEDFNGNFLVSQKGNTECLFDARLLEAAKDWCDEFVSLHKEESLSNNATNKEFKKGDIVKTPEGEGVIVGEDTSPEGHRYLVRRDTAIEGRHEDYYDPTFLEKISSLTKQSREWKVSIDLSFLNLSEREDADDEMAEDLAKQVVTKLNGYSKEIEEKLGEEILGEFLMIVDDFISASNIDDFDQSLDNLYNFGDDKSVWIDTGLFGKKGSINKKAKVYSLNRKAVKITAKPTKEQYDEVEEYFDSIVKEPMVGSGGNGKCILDNVPLGKMQTIKDKLNTLGVAFDVEASLIKKAERSTNKIIVDLMQVSRNLMKSLEALEGFENSLYDVSFITLKGTKADEVRDIQKSVSNKSTDLRVLIEDAVEDIDEAIEEYKSEEK